MEHIQCPHCNKKYGANEKIKAAAGKKIRCKHCQEIFEIVIQQATTSDTVQHSPSDTSPDRASESQSERAPESDKRPNTEKQPETDNQQSKKEEEKPAKKKTVKKQPVKKKSVNIQLVISIVLAAILLIGGIIALLYFNNPDLFKPTPKHESSTITLPAIPNIDPFAKPAMPDPVNHESEQTEPDTPPLENKNTADTSANERTSMQPKSSKAELAEGGPPKITQVCKDVAADHWIRTHKLAHRQMSSETYIKLFNQGIDQTAEVRKLCKDKSLVARLTAAAQKEVIPDWIRVEIESRTAIENARKKQLESRQH